MIYSGILRVITRIKGEHFTMTPNLLRMAAVSSLVFGALALSAPSNADVKYTMTMSMQGGDMANMPANMMPKISMTNYYSSDHYRTDMTMGGFMSKNSDVIGDCMAHKVYTMDPDLQIYYVSDMNSTAPDMFGMSNMQNMFGGMGSFGPHGAPAPSGPPRTVTEDFKIVDDGMDAAVGGHHYTITITSTGGERPTPPMNMDIWTDNTKYTYPCMDRFSGKAMPTSTTTNGTTYVLTGDIDKMREIMGGGLPVKISVQSPRGTVSFDRSDLSTDSLDNSTFTPPAGFTEVTQEQYQTQEQQAMMKHFQNMRPGGPGMPGQ